MEALLLPDVRPLAVNRAMCKPTSTRSRMDAAKTVRVRWTRGRRPECAGRGEDGPSALDADLYVERPSGRRAMEAYVLEQA